MRLDFDKYDGLILLAHDRRKGLYASQTLLRGSKTTRAAGQLPTCASAHTCELVALATALRGITRMQCSKLLANAPDGISKPRIRVVTADKDFAEGIAAVIAKERLAKPIRSGKNFQEFAASQLARFTVTIEAEPEGSGDTSLFILRDWARQNVIDPKVLNNTSPTLFPIAVSAVV